MYLHATILIVMHLLFQILRIPQQTLNKGTSCHGKESYIINRVT